LDGKKVVFSVSTLYLTKHKNKAKASNACLKCPAVKGTEAWVAMKYGKARMLGFRT
jgi:hypothetical protein